MKFFKRILLVVGFLFTTTVVLANEGFIIKQIQVRGLQNLASSTVLNYLPVHPGQEFDYAKSAQILRALYDTGFFYTASLARRSDNTLVITVSERPMISLVKLDGNKEIGDDKILPVLKKIGITTGNTLDEMKLKLFDQSLDQQYSMMGYDATVVHSVVKPLTQNRVEIDVNVSEGKIVKVGGITFTGNKSFSDRKLRHQLDLTTPSLMTIFSHKDRFSEEKLNEDLQKLTDFYMNRGYVRFKVIDKHLTYSDDHKKVFINITLEEGPIYHMRGFEITGQTLGYKDQLYKLINLKPGSVFSRAAIIGVQKGISRFYADKAYAFATISIQPDINNENLTAFITYNVMPGQRVYVRRIDFSGNLGTDQTVLRQRMLQMEGAPYSQTDIDNSKRQLMLLPYFGEVTVSNDPVIGTNDQVDVTYHVKEQPAGKASIQGGYSTAFGFLYGASITQPNFLGTGRDTSIGFQNSEVTQSYYFNYFNPYYTWYHVSRGFSVFYNHTKYSQKFNFTPYVMDSYGTTVNYVFPMTLNNSLGLDLGYSHIDISHVNNSGMIAPSVINFLQPTAQQIAAQTQLARKYDSTNAVTKWTYNSLDRYMMPTRGVQSQLSAELGVPVFGDGLSYWRLGEGFTSYLPITHGFILSVLSNVGYGGGYSNTGRLPFFYNYYAGGIGTVPGYQQNSLGPKYNQGSQFATSALGGNLLTSAGAHLILPNFISDRIRFALTFDAGNVFESPIYKPDNAAKIPGVTPPTPLVIQNNSFALKNFRMSGGLLVTWNMPLFGPIDLSLAFPLNKKPGDLSEVFQFAMGMSF